MEVEPERTSIGREANDVKEYAVPVLRMGEKAPGPRQRCRGPGAGSLWGHRDLREAPIAITVTPKLTQGPQRVAPTMIAIAKSGKKDLPKARPVRDTKARARCRMLSSFPLTLGWGRSPEQRRVISARYGLEPTL